MIYKVGTYNWMPIKESSIQSEQNSPEHLNEVLFSVDRQNNIANTIANIRLSSEKKEE